MAGNAEKVYLKKQNVAAAKKHMIQQFCKSFYLMVIALTSTIESVAESIRRT